MVETTETESRGLLERARSEEAAFACLLDLYLEEVYLYCARRLFHREAALQATAQTFFEMLEHFWGRKRSLRHFRHWLLGIAGRKTDAHLKAIAPRREGQEDEPGVQMREVLRGMSRMQANALVLTYFLHLPQDEAAEVLSVSRQRLRDLLSDGVEAVRDAGLIAVPALGESSPHGRQLEEQLGHLVEHIEMSAGDRLGESDASRIKAQVIQSWQKQIVMQQNRSLRSMQLWGYAAVAVVGALVILLGWQLLRGRDSRQRERNAGAVASAEVASTAGQPAQGPMTEADTQAMMEEFRLISEAAKSGDLVGLMNAFYATDYEPLRVVIATFLIELGDEQTLEELLEYMILSGISDPAHPMVVAVDRLSRRLQSEANAARETGLEPEEPAEDVLQEDAAVDEEAAAVEEEEMPAAAEPNETLQEILLEAEKTWPRTIPYRARYRPR